MEAKKYSHNGQVPMADGVRFDGMKELKRIVEHRLSDAQNATFGGDEAGPATPVAAIRNNIHGSRF